MEDTLGKELEINKTAKEDIQAKIDFWEEAVFVMRGNCICDWDSEERYLIHNDKCPVLTNLWTME